MPRFRPIVFLSLAASASLPATAQEAVSPTAINEPGVPPESPTALPAATDTATDTETYRNTIPVAKADAAAPTPEHRSGNRMIEEIIVTAQKREENLQDVPLSVQAFSAEMLDARGITDQRELPLITPGLDIGTQISYTTVFLRGVGTDAFLTADASVATYIDGIYFPFAQGLVQDFGAVKRVEILKGPQGTLFGRNANGGAINVITESPQFDAFSGSGEIGAANYPDLGTRVHVNVPISDSLAFSVSAIYDDSSWYVKGIADGKPLPDDITKGVRAKIRWKPADWMDATISALQLNVNGAGSDFTVQHDPTTLGKLLGVTAAPPYGGEVDSPIFNKVDNAVVYGQVEFFPGPFDTKILGSHQNIQTAGWYDFDGSKQPIVSFNPPKNFAIVDTAELQLLSNNDSWGASWLKWIVGAYYFHGISGFDPINGYIGNLNTNLILANNPNTPLGVRNALLSLGSLSAPLAQGEHLYLEGTAATNSYAAFAQTTFTLTPWLNLTLGGRFQNERRAIDKSTTGVQYQDQAPVVLINYRYALDSDGNRVGPSDTTKKFSPKVSLELRPFADDTLIYTSAQQATKSSTYNTTAITGAPTYVRPETITAYEVGAKTQLFDGLMRLNVAAWYYDIKDLQVQFFSLVNGGVVSFENAPKSRTYGFEYGVTTQLFPDWIDDLVLLTGGAYINAHYTEFPNGSGYQAPDYVFNQHIDLSGNRIVRSPEFTTNASLSKTWQTSSGSLEFAGDAYFNSGFFLEATDAPRTHQHAYEVLGAHLSYLYDPWKLRVTAFGKNLGGALYSAGGQPNDFGDGINYAPPRTYGVRLGWSF